MKKIMLAVFMSSTLLFSGCTGSKAAELFETAQFEEVQNNKEHAKQLYAEIVRKYPDSDYAKKARERLVELEK